MNSTLRLVIPTIMSVVWLAPTWAIAQGSEAVSEEEVIQRERKTIESRKTIRSGHVVVCNRLLTFAQDPAQAGRVTKYTTFFLDDRIRVDCEARGYSHQIVFTPDNYIRSIASAKAVNVFGPDTRPKGSIDVPDPRRLGLVVWFYDSICAMGYEDVFLRPGRSELAVESGFDAGKPILKVSWRVADSSPPETIEYWLSQSEGGLPVFIDIRSGEGEHRMSRSLTTKLRKYGSKEVWFPSEVVFRMVAGNQVRSEEVVSVIEAAFDDEIPSSTFTLAGLGLPIGRLVDLDGVLMTWTGSQLTQDADGTYQGDELTTRSGTRRRWLLFVGSLVLALVAVLLVFRRAKRLR